MGLNASAGFNFLNLNNNPYANQSGENVSNGTSSQSTFPTDTAGTVGSSGNTDNTYNMPQGSIYDTAGTMAYNYYNNSFSTASGGAETAGSIASSGGAETAGSIASSSGASSVSSSSSSSSSSGSSSVA